MMFLRTIVLLFISVAAQAEDCWSTQQPGGFHFESSHSSGNPKAWTLWQTANQIGYQYSEISEIWHRKTSGAVEYSRWFEQANRAIDYTNGDLKSLNRDTNWAQVSGLVKPNTLAQLKKSATQPSTFHCLKAEKYSGEIGQRKYEIVWLPQIKQPAVFIVESENKTLKTVLTHRSSLVQAQQFFAKGQRYSSMDFADIGDNEADPFVSAMINQGFVEHGEHNGHSH